MVEIQGVVVWFWVLGVLLHCRVNACQMNMDTILSASADQVLAFSFIIISVLHLQIEHGLMGA